MNSKLMLAAGYAVFFVFAFLFSLYLTFDPTNIMNAQIRRVAQSRGMEITIGSLDKYRISGINAEDVEIQPSSLKTPIKVEQADGQNIHPSAYSRQKIILVLRQSPGRKNRRDRGRGQKQFAGQGLRRKH